MAHQISVVSRAVPQLQVTADSCLPAAVSIAAHEGLWTDDALQFQLTLMDLLPNGRWADPREIVKVLHGWNIPVKFSNSRALVSLMENERFLGTVVVGIHPTLIGDQYPSPGHAVVLDEGRSGVRIENQLTTIIDPMICRRRQVPINWLERAFVGRGSISVFIPNKAAVESGVCR